MSGDSRPERVKLIGLSIDTTQKLARHLFFLRKYYSEDLLQEDAQEIEDIKQQLCSQLRLAGEDCFTEQFHVDAHGSFCPGAAR